ncbi:MAG: methyltransferase [Pseudomonadota bacterium]
MNTTRDAFLGGRLTITQSEQGYRAGADPVFLAAAVPAQPGERVLELGCGNGVAMLCLLARVAGVQATGVDRDNEALGLVRQNLEANGFAGEVVAADIPDLPEVIRQQSFDHVMTNPPFFDRRHGSVALDTAREAGRGENTTLASWLDAAIRRLSPNGTLTLIQRAERLPDCLAALDDRVGDVHVLPLAPRLGRAAKLVVLQARKGGKGPFRLAPPMLLHKGETHVKDGDSYTDLASDILRNGVALPMRN